MHDLRKRLLRGRPGKAAALLLLWATLALPMARAGADSTLSRVGNAASRGAVIDGASQLNHQVDNIYRFIDALQHVLHYGPYADSGARSDRAAKAGTPSPGGETESSTRTCVYPAGYPRVQAPLTLPSSDNSTPIRALIIKEIGSRESQPAAPDTAKWIADAQGLGLHVEAGPVRGAYLVDLPMPMSRAQTAVLIDRMYLADAEQDGATAGCRYDYVIADEPVDDFGILPPSPPRIGIGPLGGEDPISGEKGPAPLVSEAIGPLALRLGWPLIGYWANTTVAPRHVPLRLATVPVAVVDNGFMPGTAANPILTHYHGPIVYLNATGKADPDAPCRTGEDVTQGRCHGALVAAALAQDLRRVSSKGETLVVGGILGPNLYYFGTAEAPMQAPLYGPAGSFPVERIATGDSEFYEMVALDYIAGRPLGYKLLPDKTWLLTDKLDAASVAIPPLDPPARVVNLSSGFVKTYRKTSGSPCSQPWVKGPLDALREAGIALVAASGNLRAPNIQSGMRAVAFRPDAKLAVLPGDCPGVFEVGGWTSEQVPGEKPVYRRHPDSRDPESDRPYWAPYSLRIAMAPSGQQPYLARLEGTSFSAPVVAGTIAVMRSLDPGMDAATIAILLRQSAADGHAQAPVSVVYPSEAWGLTLVGRLAKDSDAQP